MNLQLLMLMLAIEPGFSPLYDGRTLEGWKLVGGKGPGYVAQAGKIGEAIEHYTKAQAAVPLPEYSAALEDLYDASGKPEDARKQAARLDVVALVLSYHA